MRDSWINIFFLVCISFSFYSQKRTFKDNNGQEYTIYMSMDEANKANPDSVLYLELMSQGFNNFPIDVIKFKNLEVLDLGTLHYLDVPDRLNKRQLRKLNRLKRWCHCVEPRTPEYKPNYIKNVPKDITKLTKLRYINLDGVHFNYKLLDDFESLLPKTRTNPDKELIRIGTELDKKQK